MSSEVARSVTLNYSNRNSIGVYDSGLSGGSAWSTDFALYTEQSSYKYYTLNSGSMSTLYPNSTAHPKKLDITMRVGKPISIKSADAYGCLVIDGVEIGYAKQDGVGNTHLTLSGNTNPAVLNSTRASAVKYGLRTSTTGLGVCAVSAPNDDSTVLTLYFTRYDFSAVAGEGVTSASVSSSTGYDGDTVTFSCVVPSGYVFDGWYNGSILVSSSQTYEHTVSGSDLSLTAKAHQQTHNVNGTYNGSTKAILTGIVGDVAVGYNSKSASLNTASPSRTLSCANKLMRDNVSVGSAVLATSGKIMRSDLVLTYV